MVKLFVYLRWSKILLADPIYVWLDLATLFSRFRCKPGYRDRLCARGPPSFTGHDSYLRLDDKPTALALSSATSPLVLNVRFKPLRGVSHGLLLAAWTVQGFLSLGLEGGALVLRFRNGSDGEGRGEEIRVVHNGTAISEGQWHRVKAVR